ncbi:hypothetical protein GCM10009810_19600 [Nostocoides vanveenii]|uniref:Gas vesicle protein n=1 Tax=Nostocoides vanveenii TaxID=330835 RepID=A0ABP4WQA7_9MICO
MSAGIITELLVGGATGGLAGSIAGAAVVLGVRCKASGPTRVKALRRRKTSCRAAQREQAGTRPSTDHRTPPAHASGEDPVWREHLDAALRHRTILREQQVSAYADQLAAGDAELRDRLRRFEGRS